VSGAADAAERWSDAAAAAALLAVDPAGLGGLRLRSLAGVPRDRWLARLRELLPVDTPWGRLPATADDDRLIGGLDLAATLRQSRPVVQPGLLTGLHGGVLVVSMAERLEAGRAALIGSVLDQGEVVLERDGLSQTWPCRLAVVALDEGLEPDEQLADALSDRLGLCIDLHGIPQRSLTTLGYAPQDVQSARRRLQEVAVDDDAVTLLCEVAARLGVVSTRASLFAVRAARAAAALLGADAVDGGHLQLATRLVLAPRARSLPEAEAPEPPAPEQGQDGDADAGEDDDGEAPADDAVEMLIAAAQAALPAGLFRSGAVHRRAPRQGPSGRVGAPRYSTLRGRRVGSLAGRPANGARLDLLATLRAAAPWQRVRNSGSGDLHIRGEDLRVQRFRQRAATATLFVVDASGSAAAQRLAEVKGAVELVLAECYVRRDEVALIAFRGRDAELLLAPTRSLVRARRSLQQLPGGGGTPLARGIDAAVRLALQIRRRGVVPFVVLLTDGRANVDRQGVGGRPQAEADALAAAAELAALEVDTVLVDTSPRQSAFARSLAARAAAAYLPLPFTEAQALSRAVLDASGDAAQRASR